MTTRGSAPVVQSSAGGVVVRTIDGEPHVLVIRDPYLKWGLPKGHVEEGESTSEAALREVEEETGLRDLRLGERLVTIDWRFRAGEREVHKYTTFFLMHSERGEPVPERAEGITDCDWVPLSEAADRVSYQNASDVVRLAQRFVEAARNGEAVT